MKGLKDRASERASLVGSSKDSLIKTTRASASRQKRIAHIAHYGSFVSIGAALRNDNATWDKRIFYWPLISFDARLLDFAYADVAESAQRRRAKEAAKRTAPGDEGGLCPRRKRGPSFFMDDVA